MSLLLKLIFICTFFYLLGMSTSLPGKIRKRKTTKKPEDTTAKPKNLTIAEQLKKEKESRAPNFDKHFYCIKNCTENAFKSCDEAFASNKNKDGVYLLDIVPNELEPFYAYCDHQSKTSKNWIVIQKRKDGSVDFYRDWFDYKYGFGDLFREYWIGLERLYQITKCENYQLWIQLVDFDGTIYNIFYPRFAVSSEADGYQLTVGGYSGQYMDCLESHNGKKFSTFDNDVSESKYNCPDKNRAGWWYHDCVELKCNLNGQKYSNLDKPGDTSEIFWRKTSTEVIIPYYVHMAIYRA